jgi:translocation and assembly module TamB
LVDSLRLAVGDDRWRLTSPARVVVDSSRIRVDSLLIRNSDSAFVAIMANVPQAGAAFAQLQARAIPLADAGTIAQLGDTLRGTANLSIVATGTKLQPVINARTRLAGIQWNRVLIDSLDANARYDRQRVIADANAARSGTGALSAHVSWPFDITLFSARQRNDSVDARISTPSTDLALLAGVLGLTKSAIDSVRGTISGFVAVGGTTAGKVYRDSLRVTNGEANIRAAGVRLVGINGSISGGVGLSGLDSTQVALTARSSARDTAALNGWIVNLARLKNEPTRFDLRLTADSLHAFNRRTIAEVYFSTPQPLRLQGSLDDPVLTGQIAIDRGAIFLSDPDLARKLAVETLADLNDTTRTSTSAMLTTFMTNLRIQNVPVTLGEDVRLRSSEADVRLAGQLELVKSNASTRLLSPSGEFVPGVSLTGTLTTTGGTYTLKFPGVQREFTVLPNGTVTFDGTSPETPLVDIRAQYNVKRLRDRDLAVIVNLTGRLPTPKIGFSSDNDYPLEESDLLSYLIIGQPGFDFASANIASFFSPTVSAYLADRLRNTALGSFVQSFQLELGTYDPNATNGGNSQFNQYLHTASLDFGVPVYKNVFVGVNAGYCQIVGGRWRGLGAKVEYRFRPDMSLQGTYDPASMDTSQDCKETSFLGLVPSHSQFSFSVHKSWRF